MALDLVVKVHPVVAFQIIDAFERRNADTTRVIGTLLGSVDKGYVEVTNCFCVPHKEYEEKVEADLNFAKDLYDLNKRVNTQEVIVGWWATGGEVTSHSALIHDYYARECTNPVHVTVDTTLAGGRMSIKAYVCVPIGVPGGTNGSMFTPVPLDVTAYNPEIVGLQLCSRTQHSVKRQVEPLPDLAQVATATCRLSSLLDTVISYVEDVLSGRTQPDNTVGRALLDMINTVPKMTREEFEEMVNSNMKDLLMVVCLAQLTKTQLLLNEKLTMLTTV